MITTKSSPLRMAYPAILLYFHSATSILTTDLVWHQTHKREQSPSVHWSTKSIPARCITPYGFQHDDLMEALTIARVGGQARPRMNGHKRAGGAMQRAVEQWSIATSVTPVGSLVATRSLNTTSPTSLWGV